MHRSLPLPFSPCWLIWSFLVPEAARRERHERGRDHLQAGVEREGPSGLPRHGKKGAAGALRLSARV